MTDGYIYLLYGKIWIILGVIQEVLENTDCLALIEF